MKISNLLSQIFNSIQLINSEHIVLQTPLYPITPIVQVFYKLSNITISYTNPGFNSYSLTLWITMSADCRPTSHQTLLCRFHSSPFFTKWIILAMCMVFLMPLPLLDIHTFYFLSNIMRGVCYETLSGYLNRN